MGEMTGDSDESLLKSFAARRDGRAFRQLADRYLGLIFHTALRRTGDRQLAEEIAQNILCALAKKAAPLARKPELLPAWLHRATLFESSKAMRSESSQQRRKQLASPADSPEPPSVWSETIPHLDAALDKLPDADRRVLLLHYFDNRPFPAIARALGKNPEAVKKQSLRALEKLRRLLLSRGVTVSAVTLAAGLGAELAKAAPAAFLKSATAAVLAGTASYSTSGLTLMTAAKSKMLAAAVVLLCLAPLAVQRIFLSKAETRIAALRSHSANLAPRPANQRPPIFRRRGISTNLDILVLADEQDDASRFGGIRQIAFAEKLAALPKETLADLIREGAAIRIPRDKKSGLIPPRLQDRHRAVACDFSSRPAESG